jgi:hypothetical protein
MSRVCPICRAANRRNAAFCSTCGALMRPRSGPSSSRFSVSAVFSAFQSVPRAVVAGMTVAGLALLIACLVILPRSDDAAPGVVGAPTAIASPNPTSMPDETSEPTSGVEATPTSPPFGEPTPVDTNTPESYDPARLVSLTSSLTFRDQDVNTTSAPQTVSLSNEGGSAQPLGDPELHGANYAEFAVSRNGCGDSLASVSGCELEVTFTPSDKGDCAATLDIVDDTGHGLASISLTGTGGTGAPDVSVSPYTVSFGTVDLGSTQTGEVMVENHGTAAVTVRGEDLTGDTQVFAVTGSCAGDVAAGSSCSIPVSFSPAEATSYSATLTVTDEAGNTLGTSTLMGVGYDTGGSSSGGGGSSGGDGGDGGSSGGDGGDGSDTGDSVHGSSPIATFQPAHVKATVLAVAATPSLVK